MHLLPSDHVTTTVIHNYQRFTTIFLSQLLSANATRNGFALHKHGPSPLDTSVGKYCLRAQFVVGYLSLLTIRSNWQLHYGNMNFGQEDNMKWKYLYIAVAETCWRPFWGVIGSFVSFPLSWRFLLDLFKRKNPYSVRSFKETVDNLMANFTPYLFFTPIFKRLDNLFKFGEKM